MKGREKLKDCKLVYHLTSMPYVLFSQLTEAIEPLEFEADKLIIPSEVKGNPVEIRVSLFSAEGELIDINSSMVPATKNTVALAATVAGFKMIEEFIQQ